MKKICVVNFWEGAFNGDFLDYFFTICFDGVTYTDNPHEADLVLSSVFGNVHTDPAKTLAFIGENVRPSFINYGHSLSFDYDSYGGRNFRLPLWYARLAWPGFVQQPRKQNTHNHGYEPLIDIASLTKPRKLDWQEKTNLRGRCLAVAQADADQSWLGKLRPSAVAAFRLLEARSTHTHLQCNYIGCIGKFVVFV